MLAILPLLVGIQLTASANPRNFEPLQLDPGGGGSVGSWITTRPSSTSQASPWFRVSSHHQTRPHRGRARIGSVYIETRLIPAARIESSTEVQARSNVSRQHWQVFQ
jgi:hypothetical protein